ncbi:MAG: ATP-binding protein [Deltaproteobacteria bacterium]|nr:ATP-binding protein [Deltaproteobacteria bacterium]
MTEYYRRDIVSLLLQALRDMPVVVISGMRQTGKTTLLRRQEELQDRAFVTFDDFAHLEAARNDPDGFVQMNTALTIDEAHKCPEILTSIKKAVDQERIPGRFLLSGSANLSILKGISESLAGRSIYFVLHPFTRREIGGETHSPSFLKGFFEEPRTPENKDFRPIIPEDVLLGGMPAVCLGEVSRPDFWFKGYEQTYMERDIREISQVGDLMAIRNLIRLAALRTGQVLNLSQIGRDAKMNTVTTGRYLSLFETSFLIYRLTPYLRNRASRLTKSPKLYLSDAGIAAFLAGVAGGSASTEDPFWGALFETYVAQNLLGISDSTWPEARLHYWSVQGRHEVDFIVEAGRRCMAIETKWGPRWDERDLSGLRAFLAATPHCHAAVLANNGSDSARLGDKLWVLPVSVLLS